MGFQKLLELLRYYQPCRQILAAHCVQALLSPTLPPGARSAQAMFPLFSDKQTETQAHMTSQNQDLTHRALLPTTKQAFL